MKKSDIIWNTIGTIFAVFYVLKLCLIPKSIESWIWVVIGAEICGCTIFAFHCVRKLIKG